MLPFYFGGSIPWEVSMSSAQEHTMWGSAAILINLESTFLLIPIIADNIFEKCNENES